MQRFKKHYHASIELFMSDRTAKAADIHGRFRYANDTISQAALWRCNAASAMFQRGMWREYAMTWKGRKTGTGVDQRWVSEILRVTFAECLSRSRAADGARFYTDAARDFGWRLP